MLQGPVSQVAAEPASLPHAQHLILECPRPFRPGLALRCVMPRRATVSLRLFDASGQRVATLASGELEAGVHRLVWDAAGLPSGVYFGRLATPLETATCKIVLTR